ncbi:MAG TPA: hydrogenase maturation protease [Anaeromyxobacteraceae bacterium]|nr:hydrogenase maturation protease [Anaeromyxobacteraceae bacterium]
MPRVLVIGQGNVLLGDEALGPEVVRVLESRYRFPGDVQLLEIGTQGLNLVPFLEGADALVSVNSLHAPGTPGEVRVLDREAVMRADREYRMSPHAFGLKGHLETLEFAGRAPREVFVVGALPEDVELRSGLTPRLKAAVPRVIDEVLSVLRRLGVEPVLRDEPLPLDLWWDAPR